MSYHNPSDSIELLDLSRRSKNALCRVGILTVAQLMQVVPESLGDMRNIGQKSIDEILDCISNIEIISDDFNPNQFREIALFRDAGGVLREDIPVEDLELSVRAINCLKSEDIRFASRLIDMTMDDFRAIPNMGKLTATQIFDKIQSLASHFVEAAPDMIRDLSRSDMFCGEAIIHLREHLLFNAGRVYAELRDVFNESGENGGISPDNHEVWSRVFEIPSLWYSLKAKILKICEDSDFGVRMDEINAGVPAAARTCGALQAALEALLAEDKLITANAGTPDDELDNSRSSVNRTLPMDSGTIARKYPSILDYTASIADPKYSAFLFDRLHGCTLEEIGRKNGLTRERVRQVVQKLLEKRPRVAEDCYKRVYSAYNWSCGDFSLAFGEPESTYNYMYLAYNKCGTADLEDLLTDTNFPHAIRISAERALYKDYLTIGGERICIRRSELVNFTLRTYCSKEMTFGEFMTLYRTLLSEWGLADRMGLDMSVGMCSNRFADSPNALCKYGKRFRYYNSAQYDFTQLFEELALDRYVDIEYSTQKFFREYPELMRQYDIRDEYELHNLLKTLCKRGKYPSVSFKRMPNIEFGTANRDIQVLDLLIQLAPVSAYDFAAAYEKEYGVLPQTVMANYVSCIDKYLNCGIYKMDRLPLPPEQGARMKSILTEDFYSVEDIARIYLREFPGEDRHNINPYTLKTLGFKVFGGYVIHDSYSSAADYCRALLRHPDKLDLRELSSTLTRSGSFNVEMYRAKSDFDIVEYEPLRFINIRKLAETGVTKDMLLKYADDIAGYHSEQKYFTVKSLRAEGFTHSLHNLGFGEWFYASLLTEDKTRFSYCRMGGTKVFCRGVMRFSMKELIAHVVGREVSIGVKDLVAMLDRELGVKVEWWKIVEVVKNSSMHYNPLIEKVSLAHDTI